MVFFSIFQTNRSIHRILKDNKKILVERGRSQSIKITFRLA